MHHHAIRRQLSIALAAIALLIVNIGAKAEADSGQATEITWEALIPKDWNPQNPFDRLSAEDLDQLTDESPQAMELMAELREILDNAPVVEELDGKMVRLPGYVVPLEFEDTGVSKFLLVPYFGACIHVPPPPANQIVYVSSKKKLNIEGLFDAVWVTGRLSTVRASSELAESEYTMKAHQVMPYEE